MNHQEMQLTGLGALLPPQIWRKLLELGPKSNPPRGRVLMRQGDPGDRVAVLVRGRVIVIRLEADGMEVPLAFRAAGEVLGDIAVLNGTPRTSMVKTVTDCEVRWVTAPAFLRFIEENRLDATMRRLYQLRLQESERARVEGGLSLKQRLCRTLDRLADRDEDGTFIVDLAMTQEEFGRMLGASRNAVVGVLAQLRDLGIVETRRRLVVIHDIDALRRCGGE